MKTTGARPCPKTHSEGLWNSETEEGNISSSYWCFARYIPVRFQASLGHERFRYFPHHRVYFPHLYRFLSPPPPFLPVYFSVSVWLCPTVRLFLSLLVCLPVFLSVFLSAPPLPFSISLSSVQRNRKHKAIRTI